MPAGQHDFYRKFGGKPFPKEQIKAANKDLQRFGCRLNVPFSCNLI